MLIQFIFKSCIVSGQRWCSKNRGWPEPHKFAYLYENLLANCPYKMFFDTETLCNPANAESVQQLTQMEDDEQAKTFFNATFKSARSVAGTNVIKLLVAFCKLIWQQNKQNHFKQNCWFSCHICLQ